MEYEVSFQTISWFNDRRNDHTLEISPKFQRRAVWLDKERSELMATIIEGLPFPEIYIHVETDSESGKQVHRVVDGQQRITSIIMFIDNQFSLPENDNFTGQYFKDLGREEKERFWDYKIVVRSLRKTNDAEIRDLFIRLNTNSLNLNDQELRNARYKGSFKQLSERLADNPLFEEMGLFSAREIRRMLDVEYVSELLIQQMVGIINKKDIIEDVYAKYDEELPNETEYEAEFNTAISLIWSIFDADNKVSFKTKGNFYTLFGCMLKYYKTTKRKAFQKTEELKSEISSFFKDVRDKDYHLDGEKKEEYQDAVSRASSDKGRRESRETILWEIIKRTEEI
jgi:hypothetical protein